MSTRIDARTADFGSIQRAKSAKRSLRARIAAAFRKIAHTVDRRTAQAQTQAFYRSSKAPWSRSLD